MNEEKLSKAVNDMANRVAQVLELPANDPTANVDKLCIAVNAVNNVLCDLLAEIVGSGGDINRMIVESKEKLEEGLRGSYRALCEKENGPLN